MCTMWWMIGRNVGDESWVVHSAQSDSAVFCSLCGILNTRFATMYTRLVH